MKRITFSIVLFASALFANAQTLIKASFQKGDKATYETVANGTLNGAGGQMSMNAKVTSANTITVKDANSEGFVIESLTSNVSSDDQTGQISDMVLGLKKYLEGLSVLVQTDKNGKPIKIINYSEVAVKAKAGVEATITKEFEKSPILAQTANKEDLIAKAKAQLTEANFLKLYTESGIFSLYGKTLKAGDSEPTELAEGIKGIVTYDVQNLLGTLSVVANSNAQLSKEEAKAFILDQMRKQGVSEDQIKQMSDNWQQLKAVGMDEVKCSSKKVTHFTKNGWASDFSDDSNLKLMGFDINIKLNEVLKGHSWK